MPASGVGAVEVADGVLLAVHDHESRTLDVDGDLGAVLADAAEAVPVHGLRDAHDLGGAVDATADVAGGTPSVEHLRLTVVVEDATDAGTVEEEVLSRGDGDAGDGAGLGELGNLHLNQSFDCGSRVLDFVLSVVW